MITNLESGHQMMDNTIFLDADNHADSALDQQVGELKHKEELILPKLNKKLTFEFVRDKSFRWRIYFFKTQVEKMCIHIFLQAN